MEAVRIAFKHKLEAMDDMVKALRNKWHVHTYKTLDGFSLGRVVDYANPWLAKLAWVHQYEAAASIHSIQHERIAPKESRIMSGKSYHLEVLHAEEYVSKRESKYKKTNTTFVVTCYINTFSGAIPDSDFGYTFPWLLTHCSDDGEQALRSYPDDRYFLWDSPPYDNSNVITIAHIKQIEPQIIDGVRRFVLTMHIKLKPKSTFLSSKTLLLQKRFTDPFTYERVLGCINRMDDQVKAMSPPLVLRLLEDPHPCVGPPLNFQGQKALTDASSEEISLESMEKGSDMYQEFLAGKDVDIDGAEFSFFSATFIRRVMEVAQEVGAADPLLQMTPSQDAIFKKCLENRLQLVWGPPGTGKTHFLALAVLYFMEALSREQLGKAATVVVTAFTHVAIENVLFRVSSLQKLWLDHKSSQKRKEKSETLQNEEDIDELGLPIFKLDDIKSTEKAKEFNIKSLKCTAKTGGEEFVDKLPIVCVIGGTVWGIAKAFGDVSDVATLLIMDEASQVPVVEAAIPLSYVDQREGRMLIAGDSKQLGTILAGDYPTLKEHDHKIPPVHDSIFKCLKYVLKNENLEKAHVGKLHENFRMNEDLCKFPRDRLYGAQYTPQPGNMNRKLLWKSVAKQQISASLRSSSELTPSVVLNVVDRAITDDRALVVIELGPRFCTLASSMLSSANHIESQLVALIALQLWHYNNDSNAVVGGNNGDNMAERLRSFWKERLFVVAPRHIQRLAVRGQLERGGFPPDMCFVDTVEKMQGQEADTVVVCYGMWSEEQAHASADFVYSLKRINVSATRARKKCILLLSSALLSPAAQVLDNPRAKKGYFLLKALREYAKVIHLD
eukprot:TRINITY_DN10391_c0_g2_i1.p1 TRINITY_DN10391_c0_g2~~TRINITY_DN10391_c0_g2_i1.p1  ORF type:complete len:983 (+),score=176.01 TRINITY_DN10391_c0_g2_i1:434-2950(+)